MLYISRILKNTCFTVLLKKNSLILFCWTYYVLCINSSSMQLYNAFLLLFFNSHPRICPLILERGEKAGVGEERAGEKNISQLPLVCAPTRDLTHNPGLCPDLWWAHHLFVYGMMLQPTEPPRQGFLVTCKMLSMSPCTTPRFQLCSIRPLDSKQTSPTFVQFYLLYPHSSHPKAQYSA